MATRTVHDRDIEHPRPDDRRTHDLVAAFPTKYLPPGKIRELPPPPRSLWKVIGPGLIAAGVGLSSGEFILWPYITSQVGLVLLWGAALGTVTQWFLNMEIERYTLATGETALTGFSRFWKHWGLVFAMMAFFANLWPGWATSSATMVTYIVGGNPVPIAIGMLLVIGAALTFAPAVYTLLERVQTLKIAAVGIFIVVAILFAINAEAWARLPDAVTHVGQIPPELGFALVMGAYIPHLVSPVTGQEEAKPSTGFIFERTPRTWPAGGAGGGWPTSSRPARSC